MSLFTTAIHSEEKTDLFLPGVSSEVMNLVLQYIYTGSVEIDNENIWDLLVLADYLCIEELIETCCRFFRDMLNAKNCIGIMCFASKYFRSDLEKEARNFLMHEFVQVSQESDEILELTSDTLQEIIAADELNVRKEEVVWECVLRWVERDEDNRRANIHHLFRRLRIGLIDNHYFYTNVITHNYVVENEECYTITKDMLMLQCGIGAVSQESIQKSLPDYARARIPHDILFVIGGWIAGEPTNNIETYDTRLDRWMTIENIDRNLPLTFHGMAVIGSSIYILGGFNGLAYLNTCHRFDAVTKTWSEVAPMYRRRCYLSVATSDDVVYAMGGYNGHERHKSAERYDYQTNQWSMIAPMKIRRSDASAAALNGKIYISGGFNGELHVNSSEMYDPEVNQWTLITAMRFGRSGLSCISYHGCLYAIGGFNGTFCMSAVEKYDPLTKVWTDVRHMVHARTNFAIAVVDEMLFVVGGICDFTPLREVECYDDVTNEWFRAGKMGMALLGLSACVVPSLPNVYEYIHSNRDLLAEDKRRRIMEEASEQNEEEEELQE
jgi:kelch-like protein 10